MPQMKKSKKFKCSVCGEKQSFRRIYARSDRAKDIRQIVQTLNLARGEMELQAELRRIGAVDEEEAEVAPARVPAPQPGPSRWADYLEGPTEQEDQSTAASGECRHGWGVDVSGGGQDRASGGLSALLAAAAPQTASRPPAQDVRSLPPRFWLPCDPLSSAPAVNGRPHSAPLAAPPFQAPTRWWARFSAAVTHPDNERQWSSCAWG